VNNGSRLKRRVIRILANAWAQKRLMFDYGREKQGDAEPVRSAAPARPFMGFSSIPAILWRRRWPILILPLAFAAVAVVYASTLPDRYQSMAQVLVDPREIRVLSNEVSPQSLSNDAITAYIESLTRVIVSTDMLQRIVERERLTTDPEYAGGSALRRIIARLVPLGDRTGDNTLRAAEQLRRNLWVRRGERTFVIDIAVTADNPEKSARLSNAFAQAFLDDQTAARSDQARRASGSLTARLAELRERVRLAEDKVESYRANKSLVGASGKLVVEEQLVAANNQLAGARSRVTDAKARLDQINSVRGQVSERGALPEAVNSNTLGILRQQLGEAQRRATSLAASLGPQHPEYLAAQSTLRDAQRGVADEIGRIREAARIEFERAQSNEKAALTQLENLKKETLAGSRDAVELRELERELEANRAVYQAFLQRARETGEQERLDTSNVRVITRAVPPLERVGPQRRVMVMLAAFAGLALGLLIAGLSEAAEWMRRHRLAEQSPPTAPSTQRLQGVNPEGDRRTIPQPEPSGGQQAQSGPSSEEDLMRLLRVMSRLEQAMTKHGMSR
jgi:uncharacterized protein involved in exopolysaccharide biosynthesis